ncbi:D-alanyl-D-alanine carboxypeptidase [Thermodesulfobacteriota bacterium]
MSANKICFFIMIGIIRISLSGPVSDAYSFDSAADAKASTEMTRLIKLRNILDKKTGANDAVIFADPEGNELYSKNKSKMLVPASTLKLLTSLAALHFLGESHRFVTGFYLDDKNNLKIKGYGDPFLVSEAVQEIAITLKSQIQSYNDLILDQSYFESPIHIPGRSRSFQPYDSPNSALCVNFNTVFFKKKDGIFISAEDQTPLLPLALKKIKNSGLSRGRIMLSSDNDETLQYAGELSGYFLNEQGVKSNGHIRVGKVDIENDKLILSYNSKLTTTELVSSLLEYSNNFIANQLLIAIGAQQYGPPGNLEKGVRAVQGYIKDVLNRQDIRMVEGSGISRENLMSAEAMLKALEAFKPYHELMRHNDREYYKTGHLNGIRTRIGYIESNKGLPYSYIVFINSPGKTTSEVMQVILEYAD